MFSNKILSEKWISIEKRVVEAEDNLHCAFPPHPLLIQAEDLRVHIDHTRRASHRSHLERKRKKGPKWIMYFLLFDKKELINLQREKLILWFPNSKRNSLKVMKMSLDNIIGILLKWSFTRCSDAFHGFLLCNKTIIHGGEFNNL